MATTALEQPPNAIAAATDRTVWQDARRRFLRNRLATAGLCVVALFIIFAVFADVLAPEPYDRSVLSETLRFPSARHWLGTDQVGRDMLSRMIYGARTSLIVGFAVQGLAFGIGIPLGALAGLRAGGWADFVVIRLVEVMSAFPSFLFALFILSVIGGGLFNVIFAICGSESLSRPRARWARMTGTLFCTTSCRMPCHPSSSCWPWAFPAPYSPRPG
jgi:peptide/nickel transport system permease protein